MSIRKKADSRLREAVEQYYVEYFDEVSSNEELNKDITFTPEFEIKMQKIVNSYKKSYYRFISTTARKVASILLIVFISLGITMSVKAFREPVVRFFIEVYEKFSTVTFQPEEKEELPPPTIIEQYFEPSYLPEGYVEVSRNDFENIIQIEYENESGEIMSFFQMTMENRKMSIDTEGTESKEIMVNDNVGIFSSNKGNNTILWDDGQYAYFISTVSVEETILEIAKSLEKIEK